MKIFKVVNAGIHLLMLGAMAPAFAQQGQHEPDSKPRGREEHSAPHSPAPQANTPRQEPRPQPEQRPSRQAEQRPARQPEQRPTRQPEQRPARPVEQQGKGQPRQAPIGRDDPRAVPAAPPQPRRPSGREAPRVQPPRKPAASSTQPKQQGGDPRAIWQQHRAQNWKSEHRNWQERGGYRGYRIPTARYRNHFGSGHSFRILNFPLLLAGGHPRFHYGGFWISVIDPWPEYWSDTWYDDDDVYIEYSMDGYYIYNRRYSNDRIAISISLH